MIRKTFAVGIIFLFIVSSIGSVGLETKNADMPPVEPANGPMDSAWPMFGHDLKHSGRSPYAPSGNWYRVKWKFWMDGRSYSSPVVDNNGTIYIGAEDFHDSFFAININGTEKWRFDAGEWVDSSPAITDDGTIYVGSNDGDLLALNCNGTEKWRFHAGSWIFSSPAIDEDGIIYVGSTNNIFYAINPNGTEKWRFETGFKIYSSPAIDDNGIIYFGSHDYHLYALYPNGTMKWRYRTDGEVKSPPAIGDDGTIYVCSWDNYLHAVYSNGTRKWRFNTGASAETSPSIADDGTIYVGSYNGKIYSITPSGNKNWEYPTGDLVLSSPAIDNNGIIYIGSMDGNLYTLNPDGALIWKFEGGDKIESSPIIDEDGMIYIAVQFEPSLERSSYTYLYALEIIINEPPTKPTINGETNGYIGESYEYTFIATDLDDDDIWYYIEWGDESNSGWIGPYESGEEVLVSHTWDEKDTYTIRAKARDIFDAESEWGTLEVTMPVNQQNQYPLLELFRERFPLLYQILFRVLEELNI